MLQQYVVQKAVNFSKDYSPTWTYENLLQFKRTAESDHK